MLHAHPVAHGVSLSLALALLVAAPARAQSSDVAPEPAAAVPPAAAAQDEAAAARELARQHFNRGVELAGQGEYEAALSEFQDAHRVSPNYVVLYNIAQAYILLGRPLEAIEMLERYVREGADQLPTERVERVAQQIEAQRIQRAELRIAVNVPSAALELDGRAVGSAPLTSPLYVNPGTHLLTVRAPERPPLLRSVVLGAGQLLDLALELPSPPPPIAALEPAPILSPVVALPPAPVRDAPPSPPSEALRSTSYALGGAGVLLAGATLAHYFWNHGRYERWQDENEALSAERVEGSYIERQQANNERADSIDSAERVTLGLGLAAAACLTSGAVLFAIDASQRGSETHVGGVRVAVRGTW
jgi:tetratricopeptide (TPR) repeat protein